MTLLQEACAIVNSTPLWEISADPLDPVPLSPSMLLTMKETPNHSSLESFSSHDVLAYGGSRWRRVQYLAQQFWSRWRSHYINHLQTRQKWFKRNHDINVGDLVLLKDKTTKRNDWPLALIKNLNKSSDGLVRSVTLKVLRKNKAVPSYLERSIHDTVLLIPSRATYKNDSCLLVKCTSQGGVCRP